MTRVAQMTAAGKMRRIGLLITAYIAYIIFN